MTSLRIFTPFDAIQKQLCMLTHTIHELQEQIAELQLQPCTVRLYSENDTDIFQQNVDRLQIILADDQFISLVDMANKTRKEPEYTVLHAYCTNLYSDFIINVFDSCNGVLFMSESQFNQDMLSWNVGGRSEIILAMMAGNYLSYRPVPFFQDLLNQGFGFSRRTRFIDQYQTDMNEYHFICRQVEIGGMVLFVVVREK